MLKSLWAIQTLKSFYKLRDFLESGQNIIIWMMWLVFDILNLLSDLEGV